MADISFGITGNASEFLDAMNEAKERATETLEQISEHVKGVGETFETLQRTAAAFAAAVVGGEVLEKLGQLAERAENMKDLAEQFNISTTSLQGLQTVAAETGVDTERLTKAATGLQSEMAKAGIAGGEAAEKFEALGITYEELRDPAFSVVDAMTKLGVESNSSAALVGVLGPRIAVLLPVMRELAANHHAVADAAERSNALTGQEIQELEEFHAKLELNETAWKNYETRIAVGVVPALQAAVEQLTAFATSSSSATDFGELLTAAIVDASAAVIHLVEYYKDLMVVLFGVWQTGVAVFGGLADAQTALLQGKFGEFARQLKLIPTEVKAAWQAVGDSIVANSKDAESAINTVAIAASGLSEVHPTLQKEGKRNPLPDTSKLESDPAADLFAQLEEKTRQSEQERLGIIVRSAQEETDARRDAALGAIAVAEQEAQQQYNLGQITAEQLLEQERNLAREKLGIELQAASQKALLAGQDVKAQSRADQEIAKAHAANLLALGKAQETFAQQVRQTWQRMSNQIASAFSGAIKGMLQGTETFGQAVQSIWNSLLGSFIDMLVQMLEKWIVNHFIQKSLEQTGAQSSIATAAGVAGAQGTASFAGAPWPIDLGAPAFGAAMAAAAGSFSIASAAGGYDIPSGVNPLTQLHEREMVLDKGTADTVRDGMKRRGGDVHIYGKESDNVTVGQVVKAMKAAGWGFKLHPRPGSASPW